MGGGCFLVYSQGGATQPPSFAHSSRDAGVVHMCPNEAKSFLDPHPSIHTIFIICAQNLVEMDSLSNLRKQELKTDAY